MDKIGRKNRREGIWDGIEIKNRRRKQEKETDQTVGSIRSENNCWK